MVDVLLALGAVACPAGLAKKFGTLPELAEGAAGVVAGGLAKKFGTDPDA